MRPPTTIATVLAILSTVSVYTVMAGTMEDTIQDARDQTVSFELFSGPALGGQQVYAYGVELEQSAPMQVFAASRPEQALHIKSAKIERAEGGLIIGFYHTLDDEHPAMTISFAIDIHKTVMLEDLEGNFVKDNVRVTSLVPHPTSHPFSRIEISKPFPQFLILGGRFGRDEG